jgi:hypothetical protein
LFLLFGLVESIDAGFFAERIFSALAAGDYNADGAVDAADYSLWKSTFGSRSRLPADGNADGVVDAADYVIWRNAVAPAGTNMRNAVPELSTICMAQLAALVLLLSPRQISKRSIAMKALAVRASRE